MRYKHFKPLVHNFSHSFMGGCNYVDDGFVFADLITLARSRRGAPVIIQWWPQTAEHDPELSDRVLKSIGYYQIWLPRLSASLGVSLTHLDNYRTELYLTINRTVIVKAIAQDDKGRVYNYDVKY